MCKVPVGEGRYERRGLFAAAQRRRTGRQRDRGDRGILQRSGRNSLARNLPRHMDTADVTLFHVSFSTRSGLLNLHAELFDYINLRARKRAPSYFQQNIFLDSLIAWRSTRLIKPQKKHSHPHTPAIMLSLIGQCCRTRPHSTENLPDIQQQSTPFYSCTKL